VEKELFGTALGIEEPVYVEAIEFDRASGELHIHMNFRRGGRFACSECGTENLPIHDTADKKWRHLNFFQYKCYIHLRTPRTICPDCGQRLWLPPWARRQSGFTLLFEAFVMALVKEMPVSCIGELVDEHDTRLWRIVRGYVERAYAEKSFSETEKVGVDETSSKKGHNYVTIFADMDTKEVLFATEGKDGETLTVFTKELPKHDGNASNIKEIAMDMSPAFIAGAANFLPEAQITFDRFHVMKALNTAVDTVRRQEVKQNPLLKRTRYIWLKNPENLTEDQKKQLATLSKENLKTAKAYQLKQTFQDIYALVKEPVAAAQALEKWLKWADRSKLPPLRKFAKLVKRHKSGILRFFHTRLTSGTMEGINSRVQEIKRRARGYRNIRNFIAMIYLEAAGLDLMLPT
jgi:transposase